MDSNLDIPVFLLKVVMFLKVYAFSTCTLISQLISSWLLFFMFFVIFSHSITGIILYMCWYT